MSFIRAYKSEQSTKVKRYPNLDNALLAWLQRQDFEPSGYAR